MENKDIVSAKEIDLIDLTNKLWLNRKFIIKISIIGFIVGVIIAFSIPKEYTTTVILAPEVSSNNTGGVGALAAMAGVNIPSSGSDGQLSPELYPDIIESTPFIVGLFDIHITDVKNEIDTTLYVYLEEDQKSAWWSYILNIPSKLIGVFLSDTSNDISDVSINNSKKTSISLTKKEMKVYKNLKERINVEVNKKTGVITLTSTMQSPIISAYIADTVTMYLQDYIIDYRTLKAREDLVFTERLYNEAKVEYYKAQQNYAAYSDENLNVISARYRTTQERLQNEMTLAYGVYNQMAQQLQLSKVKVQDTKPVYTVIQPAIVPLIPEKPNKKIIVVVFVLLASIGACAKIIMKDLINSVLKH